MRHLFVLFLLSALFLLVTGLSAFLVGALAANVVVLALLYVVESTGFLYLVFRPYYPR